MVYRPDIFATPADRARRMRNAALGADPPWKGFTLDDLVRYAQTGEAVSSVPEGKVGYGLDEVGNADVYQPGGKGPGFDWRKLVGSALAGAAYADPRAGFLGNAGRGFLGAQAWSDDRESQRRRNEALEQEKALRQAQTDKIMSDIISQPMENARKEIESQLQRDADRERIRQIQSQVGLAEGRAPGLIDADRALAEQRRAAAWRSLHAPFSEGGGERATTRQDLASVERQVDDTRADLARAERELPTRPTMAAYDTTVANRFLADSTEVGRRIAGLQTRADSLGIVRDSLAAAVQNRPFERTVQPPPPPPPPTPTFTGAPILARPPAARAVAASSDPNDPTPAETAQQYADRVKPLMTGAEARRRWQRAHP